MKFNSTPVNSKVALNNYYSLSFSGVALVFKQAARHQHLSSNDLIFRQSVTPPSLTRIALTLRQEVRLKSHLLDPQVLTFYQMVRYKLENEQMLVIRQEVEDNG